MTHIVGMPLPTDWLRLPATLVYGYETLCEAIAAGERTYSEAEKAREAALKEAYPELQD
jgi:hypothetical protein